MNIEDLATKHDLEMLKSVLLQAMKEAISTTGAGLEKEYLRTKEVRQILGVSNGTLSNLRVKGLLKPSKIDGIYYYRLSEIKTLLSAGTE